MSTTPAHPIPSAAGLSTAGSEPRATFGWRPGSIRGLLSLMVLGLLWSVALLSPEWRQNQTIPLIYVYLQYLLVLIVAYYFPPYGSISPSRPGDRRIIRFWPEIVPWILVAGSIGLAVWVFQSHRKYIFPSQAFFSLPLVVLGGFFIGHALTWLFSRVSGGQLPAWFQDLQAWVALLGMAGLATYLVIHLFVQQGFESEVWEGIVTGLVAFYFGARAETPRVLSFGVSG
jgi:hypothetical protein